MDVKTALLERRTIRKFTQTPILEQDLTDLIEYARLAAYPANLQPLKFAIITENELCNKVFDNTKWAGYLPDGTPKEAERPTAFIAVLGDTEIKNSFEVEAGAAVTSMMLGALEKGIGSCWIGALNKKNIMEALELDEEKYNLLYVLALGYPAQESQACPMQDNNVKYFLDENNKLNVPKRSMNEVLLFKK
ncbi:MAG: nitroreductase family protein [Clostridia bacterium]|nr:nitroreductase family protein [Clostridia bacterium]